ncbi:MAG: hypothetical protein CMA91_02945 [Euryarchaeota archaeon]|nr:hypothetical protein [Euryarchaeota archaeon]
MLEEIKINDTICVKLMSVFISNKAKERTKNFWFGLAIPIVVGVGTSLFSMSFWMMNGESIANDEYAISDYFFGTFYISGVLIIWPLLAWLLLQRANKSQILGYREGCRMSIKIYIGLIIFIIISNLSAFFFFGERM